MLLSSLIPQPPSPIKFPRKGKKGGFGLRANTKIPCVTLPHPTPPTKSQYDPPRWSGGPGG